MDYFQILIFSLVSAAVLFFLAKLMGNKQVSQLNMFDYVTGITIGSIAAEMATGLDTNPLYAVIAMAVYGGLDVLFALLSQKSLRCRRWIVGAPRVLMHGGKIYRENLKKARMELGDFLALCRINGYFSPSEIDTAILEINGNISFLPAAQSRPVTPQDLSLSPAQQQPVFHLILDGKIQRQTLTDAGKDLAWLRKKLKEQGFSDEHDVFFAACSGEEFFACKKSRELKKTVWF